MRSAVAILSLLTACATDPRPISGPHPLLFVAKTDLDGTWSHRAIVLASDTPSVAVGDEASSEIHFVLEDDLLLAHDERHETRLALRIESHFDVEERTLTTGETAHLIVDPGDRPWWQRNAIRLDSSSELAGTSIPTVAALEPMALVDPEPRDDLTYLPERDDEGALVWTFQSAYWIDGSPPGEVLVRHELERIEP